MLESLRGIQNSRPGKAVIAVIMGLIMVSFVIWGIGPVFTGFNANQIATVGGTPVTVDQFRQAYQTELQRLQQRTRQTITAAQAHQYGIDTQVLSRLVSEAVLDNQAQALGLSISDDQVARAILDDPDFKGADGKFNRAQFDGLLRDNGLSEQQFVREQRATYLRQELVQGLVGNVTVPQAALDQLHRFGEETRSLDLVAMQPSMAGPLPAPDPAVLEKFFDDRAAAYRAPEVRKLVILPILPAAVAKPGEVSEADVERLYDQVRDSRFTAPEIRTLRQIVFPSEGDAQAAAARIKAGASFAEVAAERKLSGKDVDLGAVTKDQVHEKPVAEAAFALPEGGTSDAVKNAFGATVVHVVKVVPAVVKPLAEVAENLRDDLARGRAGNAVRSLRAKADDARASGKSLTEAAALVGLPARTVEVDASGKDKDGAAVDLPNGPALLKAVFASDVGVDNDPVPTADGGAVFFEVAAVEPARARGYDEVKERVDAQWRDEETAKQLARKADDLVKAVNGGQAMEKVAADLGLPLQHAADVRRAGGTGVGQAVATAAFAQPVGKAGSAAGESGARVVFKTLGSVVPALDADAPQTKRMSERYQSWLAEDMIGSTLTAMEGKLTVKVNPEAFRTAVGS